MLQQEISEDNHSCPWVYTPQNINQPSYVGYDKVLHHVNIAFQVTRTDSYLTHSLLGGPAHTLRLFKTQRHAYLFSGIVYLGD